ncbi:hypothetical protein EKK58_02280 [Candidatus Dependentiae bacterium]|nr:MAG: hypothetical protein EKK58_02280 [Candidatus Dependentiae bacterium]
MSVIKILHSSKQLNDDQKTQIKKLYINQRINYFVRNLPRIDKFVNDILGKINDFNKVDTIEIAIFLQLIKNIKWLDNSNKTKQIIEIIVKNYPSNEKYLEELQKIHDIQLIKDAILKANSESSIDAASDMPTTNGFNHPNLFGIKPSTDFNDLCVRTENKGDSISPESDATMNQPTQLFTRCK